MAEKLGHFAYGESMWNKVFGRKNILSEDFQIGWKSTAFRTDVFGGGGTEGGPAQPGPDLGVRHLSAR